MFGKTWLANEGGESDSNAVLLGTRKTRHIPNEKRPEWEPEQLKEALQKCQTIRPDAELRSVSATYNCVGMIFATRRTWVDPDHVYRFLEDDEYRQIDRSEIHIGDIVVYKMRPDSSEVTHVGVIVGRVDNFVQGTVSFKVLSKWGVWAEFIHDPDYVLAEYGSLTEYWTDRKLYE
jgi:hypothetical protein